MPLKAGQQPELKAIIEILEKILNSSIVKKANRFYFVFKKPKREVEASLVGEGARKLGMLAYLLINGSLQNGASLIWDEPDAYIQPELTRDLAKILTMLSENMQLIIASNNALLMQSLERCNTMRKISPIKHIELFWAKYISTAFATLNTIF